MQEITQDDLQQVVGSGPVLIDFYTDWCIPCKSLRPMLDDIAQDRPNLTVVAVNIENSVYLAEKYGVSSVPTMMLLEGNRQQKIIGMRSKHDLTELIDAFF